MWWGPFHFTSNLILQIPTMSRNQERNINEEVLQLAIQHLQIQVLMEEIRWMMRAELDHIYEHFDQV